MWYYVIKFFDRFLWYQCGIGYFVIFIIDMRYKIMSYVREKFRLNNLIDICSSVKDVLDIWIVCVFC